MSKIINLHKKIVAILVLVICLISVIFFSINTTVSATENSENIVINQFVQKYGLNNENITIKELRDFNKNRFLLAEFSDKAYAIYTKDTMRFIEGSGNGKSPYLGYTDELYYLGPLSYYVEKNDKIYDILSGEICDFDKNSMLEYDFNDLSSTKTTNLSNNSTVRMSNSSYEPKKVTGHEYFENATYPDNTLGTCAITAISILLGYFDTYHNDNFIDDESENVKYINKKRITTTSSLSIQNMQPIGVGTTNGFGDLLINKHMHYNELLESLFGGYPMAEMEIKETIKDYLLSRPKINNEDIVHHSGSIINTTSKPASYIESDIPVILVLSKYDHQNEKKGWHTVVAYGYDEEAKTFIVNYGWGSEYNSVILSDYAVYAYYVMEYKGEHVHSGNMVADFHYSILGTNYIGGYEKCGCGQLSFVSNKKVS